ncbi:MAG: TonB-dependent receptor [Acidimicrobiia bacterium]|nr:TonB-dependent receptor [Acidimicrobiia bacterium]
MRLSRVVLAATMVVACAAAGWAQSATTGAIAGVVRDTTGAVLPGVTVEASSPALIEKVRVAVTDDQGNYKIIDLRPGAYAVTFTLPGFSTFKREGLELTTGFTATANADMQVGSLEETVTVSGASPVVDIQNVRQQRVLSRELLDSVPTNKTFQGFAALTLGATPAGTGHDVGGNRGDGLGGFGFHGSRTADQRLTMDGMLFTGLGGGAQMRNIVVNQAFVQETTLEVRGASAESEAGGAHINVVPKDGGNAFSSTFTGAGSGSALQATNITEELQARGLPPQTSSKKIWDVGGGMGGPIRQDKLWYYTAIRWWGAQTNLPGAFYNANQGKYVGDPDSGVTIYQRDTSRPAFQNIYNRDYSVRFTWQATQKSKYAISTSLQDNCNCTLGSGPSAPESYRSPTYWPISLTQLTWNYPASNRVLIDAGTSFLYNNYTNLPEPEVSPRDIALRELSNGMQYNARAAGLWLNDYGYKNLTNQWNSRVAISYVTGSHAFKAGLTYLQGWQQYNVRLNDRPMEYQLRNFVPVSLRMWASPFEARGRFSPNMGLYAQDQWTISRLTLNLGVRYDYLHGINPSHESPAGPFVPARSFPTVDALPRFSDLAPRVGAAYDLFGDGKTAVKVSLGRYVELASIWTLTYNTNPMAQIAQFSDRTWNDANRNYVPDCNLLDPSANGECGRGSTATLGQLRIIQQYDKQVTEGFGNRPMNWQAGMSVQHEIAANMALNFGYYRTWFGNFTVNDNRATTPADFDPYCVTAPTDTRLGDASGARLCGLYDINPSRFGQQDNIFVQHATFGERTEVYNGVDLGLSARFGEGGLVQGGVSTGRTQYDNCAVVDSPQAAREGFCNYDLPFEGQTQYKLSFVYPLPLDVRFSGTYQNLPGAAYGANFVVTNAQIAPSLGRNLAAGAGGTVIVDILPPNRLFEERLSQLDLRLTKIFRFGRGRLQGMFDIYNIFNANTVLGLNSRFGAAWRTPSQVLAGRLFKFGGQFDF